MTYKLELFLVLQKKKAYKYKIIQKLCFLFFYGLLILDSSFFYIKLTHLIQKFKKKKIR